MFLSRNKKTNAYPCKPQFYYIKVGFKGVKITQVCFRDGNIDSLVLGHNTEDRKVSAKSVTMRATAL